jgi:sugar phosphate isomerase/epimerase
MSSPFTRRTFLGASAAATVLASRSFGKNLAPARIGVELYTLRNEMPAKDAEVLKEISQIGYREVEGDYPTLTRIASKLKSLQLNPISCHIPVGAIDGKGDTPLEKIFADLKGLGTQYAVVPYIMPDQRTAAILASFGDKMNKAGELAKKSGLQLCYHNHAFEWGPMNGKRAYEVMFGNTDPKLVQFEVDVFWLSVGGVDPVHFLEQHAGRVPLLHLKDKAQGQKVQFNENVTKETFKEVGNGSLDFPAILKTAEKIGVKHYFVEQDQTPGDPVASLKQSFTYLSGLRG